MTRAPQSRIDLVGGDIPDQQGLPGRKHLLRGQLLQRQYLQAGGLVPQAVGVPHLGFRGFFVPQPQDTALGSHDEGGHGGGQRRHLLGRKRGHEDDAELIDGGEAAHSARGGLLAPGLVQDLGEAQHAAPHRIQPHGGESLRGDAGHGHRTEGVAAGLKREHVLLRPQLRAFAAGGLEERDRAVLGCRETGEAPAGAKTLRFAVEVQALRGTAEDEFVVLRVIEVDCHGRTSEE